MLKSKPQKGHKDPVQSLILISIAFSIKEDELSLATDVPMKFPKLPGFSFLAKRQQTVPSTVFLSHQWNLVHPKSFDLLREHHHFHKPTRFCTTWKAAVDNTSQILKPTTSSRNFVVGTCHASHG